MDNFPQKYAQLLPERVKIKPLPPKIVGLDFKPKWAAEMSNEEYHSHHEAVSSTGIRKVLKSPASFLEHITPNPNPGPDLKLNEAQNLGTLVHKAILEPGAFFESFAVIPKFGPMQSSKNRAERDAWLQTLPKGITPCTEEQLWQTHDMVMAVANHTDARALLRVGGIAEASGFYRDPITGILCRIRPDFMHYNLGALCEIKTTRDVSRDSFSRTIWEYGYHIQLAMQAEGIFQIVGIKVDMPSFIAVEKEPPYEVAVYAADEEMMARGRKALQRALAELKQCITANHWPQRQSRVENISLPRWALQEE